MSARNCMVQSLALMPPSTRTTVSASASRGRCGLHRVQQVARLAGGTACSRCQWSDRPLTRQTAVIPVCCRDRMRDV
jgi:hypothetical protein